MIKFTTFNAILLLIHIFAGQLLQYAIAARPDFIYSLDEGYPIGKKLFGNIAAVDVDQDDNVIIFHRGTHKWEVSTFDANDNYLPSKEDPILEETIVTIDPKEKKIVRAWGRNIFFMPHGLSLDPSGQHVWLTDVALHQVFKYTVDGTKELIALGTPFLPGNDDSHFCKPTSVADTGDFIFVADGYCNSRIVMFSSSGKYLGEFGQSSAALYLSQSVNNQPMFNIPHKITYAKESKMLCVADRENGRIQCFSFEPRQDKVSNTDNALILNGAIKPKFTIADPAFNGRLFSLDYNPIRGGIIVAVSGSSLYSPNKPPLGFVYNVTTGQLISKFAPPPGRTFGMAHDVAVTGGDAESLFVVDVSPVNLWKFSRPFIRPRSSPAVEITKMAGEGFTRAIHIMHDKEHDYGFLWFLLLFSIVATVVVVLTKARKLARQSTNSFAALYSSRYPTSINSLFGNNRFHGRPGANGTRTSISTMFSRRAFFNIFGRNQQQQNEFSRIPLEESDISDDDKSDSDVEEFNINQAASSVNINV